jgi:hypothetical protein
LFNIYILHTRHFSGQLAGRTGRFYSIIYIHWTSGQVKPPCREGPGDFYIMLNATSGQVKPTCKEGWEILFSLFKYIAFRGDRLYSILNWTSGQVTPTSKEGRKILFLLFK